MSGCGCGCGSGGPIIINCGGVDVSRPGGGGQDPSLPDVGDENGEVVVPHPPPLIPTRCTRILIRMNQLQMVDAGSENVLDNLLDPGDVFGVHQWNLTVTVNGIARNFTNDDVRDNQSFSLSMDFTVDIDDPNTVINIQASGFEQQLFGTNPLPTAVGTHGSGDNFGIGTTHQISGSSQNFSYSISYSISCLTQEQVQNSIAARSQVLQLLKGLIPDELAQQINDDRLVANFIRRVEDNGLKLKTIEGENLIFEGTQSVGRIVKSIYNVPKKKAQAAKKDRNKGEPQE